jgi:hypothetical protein
MTFPPLFLYLKFISLAVTMAAVLEPCSLPFKISDVPITNEEISIFVKCHDRMFSKVTVVDDKDRELFIGGGPGPMKSWSWRRQVKDTSGVPIFDLRHHGAGMKNLWTVENPDGHLMAELKHVSGGRRSDVDMVAVNGKGEENDIVLQIRQKDQSGITTQQRIQQHVVRATSVSVSYLLPILE